MNSKTEITILGCGTSTGVPVISCACVVCTSSSPKNNRTRSSLLLQGPQTAVLIDTGPDLRQQLLREQIVKVDAVLYTHAHLDHVVGFDELRAFCWNREDALPLHGSSDTLQALHRMFPWAFDNENTTKSGYVRARAVPFLDAFQIGEFHITPFEVIHPTLLTHGFRILLPSGKSFCYLSDVKTVPSSSLTHLQNSNLHFIDGLRYLTHSSHMTIEEASELANAVRSPLTYFTHLSHDIDYLNPPSLPENRKLAYDGLKLTL